MRPGAAGAGVRVGRGDGGRVGVGVTAGAVVEGDGLGVDEVGAGARVPDVGATTGSACAMPWMPPGAEPRVQENAATAAVAGSRMRLDTMPRR